MSSLKVGLTEDNSLVVLQITDDTGAIINVTLDADQSHQTATAILRGELVIRAMNKPIIFDPTTPGKTVPIGSVETGEQSKIIVPLPPLPIVGPPPKG